MPARRAPSGRNNARPCFGYSTPPRTPPPLPPLQEIGVQTGPCTQWVTVDLGALYALDTVRAYAHSWDAASTALMTSADNVTWASAPLDPRRQQATNVTMDGATYVRFVRVTHTITNKAGWIKVYVG